MNKSDIIKDLKLRKKVLSKQAESLPDFANDDDELEFSASVNAKLDLIEDLLELYKEKQ